jgi:hypothetical protein
MGLDSVGPSGGESSKRKGEGSLVRGGPIHAAQEEGRDRTAWGITRLHEAVLRKAGTPSPRA